MLFPYIYICYEWRTTDLWEHATTYKNKLNIPQQKWKLNIKTQYNLQQKSKQFYIKQISLV